MTYEWIQELLKPEGATEFGMLGTIVAGGMAGVCNWLVGMPADVLKSRLQAGKDGFCVYIQHFKVLNNCTNINISKFYKDIAV